MRDDDTRVSVEREGEGEVAYSYAHWTSKTFRPVTEIESRYSALVGCGAFRGVGAGETGDEVERWCET